MMMLKRTLCLFVLVSTACLFADSVPAVPLNPEIYTFPYPFSVFCSTSILLRGTDNDASSGSALLVPTAMETNFKQIFKEGIELRKSVRVIFYQPPASIPEIESILQTMYPDIAAVIICRFSDQAEVAVSAISSRNSVFFRIISGLSADEPSTRFSLINHYLYANTSGKSAQILNSLIIDFPGSFFSAESKPFWGKFISVLSDETYKNDKIYLLPLATLLVPVWEPVFYALFMFFVLFNIALFLTSARAKIRYGFLYWLTALSLCVTVWFSLVFSLYLALAMFIIQPHFGRRIKIPVFLLLTLFWIGVLLHDFVLLVSGGLALLQAIYCVFFLLHYLALAYASFSRRKAH